MYYIDEENSDVEFEVIGNKVSFKVGSGSGGSGGSKVYLITVGDETVPTDKNTFSALRIIAEIAQALSKFKEEQDKFNANRFLRKDQPDRTAYLLTLLAGACFGAYEAGLSGACIDAKGHAELESLLVRLKATLAELQVNGSSIFRGNLSSENFISGFVGGKGWAVTEKEVVNAAGQKEKKYTGEFDSLVIRDTLRVFEMVVSQLLGENDNRIFTGMMVVDHFDPETGRVWLDTKGGSYYNPFRTGDCIQVQQFNGLPSEDNDYTVTKQYELVIADAGIGNLGAGTDRLDWVTFRDFTAPSGAGPASLIARGDTFVRVDNLANPDRKGIMQIITVGHTAPYLDVLYGLKTDPDNALKGRMGNLEGIQHNLFGWLKGFGEYLTNLYAVGDFRLRQTGESTDSRIDMLQNVFSTSYRKMMYDLTEEDNYLTNASFCDDLKHWVVEDSMQLVAVGNEPLLVNKSTLAVKDTFTLVEQYRGADCLHICNSQIRQNNADIRQPKTHKEYVDGGTAGSSTEHGYAEVRNRLYLGLRFRARTSGTLTVGFQGAGTSDPEAMRPVVQSVSASPDWQEIQASGTWDGTGYFILRYTGEMYVSLLAVTDNPLDDYRKEVETSIAQTASNIRLLGKNINRVEGTVTELGLDLDAANERISLYANKLETLTGTVTQLGLDLDAANERISLYANKLDTLTGTVTQLGVRMNAAEGNIDIYANKLDKLTGTVTDLGIRLDTAEGNIDIYASKVSANESAIAALQVRADSISSTVTDVQGDLEDAKVIAEKASSLAKQKAEEALSKANQADGKADINATSIFQNAQAISAVAARFNADGTLKNTSGLVLTSDFTSLYTEAVNKDGNVVKKAELSTYVTYDKVTGKIQSNVRIAGDQIDLEGVITANNRFKILLDGSMEATAGKIGGFTIGPDRLGIENNSQSTDWKTEGMFLYRNMIGFNTADRQVIVGPTSTLGTEFLGRFVSRKDTYDSNYGLVFNMSGSRIHRDYAFLGTGHGVLNGVVEGYRLNKVVFTRADTAYFMSLSSGKYVEVHCPYGNCWLVLPRLSELRQDLGLSSTDTKNIAVRLTLVKCSGVEIDVCGRRNATIAGTSLNTTDFPVLRNWGFADAGYWNFSNGDVIEVLLVYSGGEYNAYTVTLNR